MLEALEEPGGAGLLAKRWGWDAKNFEMPAAKLRLMQVQPVERAMHRWIGGQASNAELGGVGHLSGSRFGIFDVDEEEACRWSGWAGGGSVADGEQVGNGIGREAVGTTLDKGSD